MTNSVNKTHNSQEVNLHTFKAGQKINSCKTEQKKSIFNAIDANKDGVISKDEMQGVVKGKIKNKDGKLVEREYIKLKDIGNGRSLVVDENGKQHVIAHNGVVLKDSYVKNGYKQPGNTKAAQKTAASIAKTYKNAEAAFNKQLADDGWAGDLADGFSKLWNNDLFGGGTGNTASQVREELKAEKKRVALLTNAAKKGDAAFKAQFKKIYGVDYNQAAVDAYNKNPTEANYKKAFGTKIESIKTRVDRYNKSQQTGAEAVKTTAKIGAGIAVGAAVVATGGAGAVALGATALGTAAASAAVDETDRLQVTGSYKDANGKTVKTKGAFREGTDHTQILKNAAWDGAGVLAGGAVGAVAGKVVTGTSKAAIAGRAAINISGDVAMGAAQEYAETGQVTATGVMTNAAMSGIGSAITSGAMKKGVNKIKNKLTGHSNSAAPNANIHTTANVDVPNGTHTTNVDAPTAKVNPDVQPEIKHTPNADAPTTKATPDTSPEIKHATNADASTAKATPDTSPEIKHTTNADIKSRLSAANSREEFVALRDEIKNMPNSPEKQALIKEYTKSERNWRMNPERPDIRMQYDPETTNSPTAKATPDAPPHTTNTENTMTTQTTPIKTSPATVSGLNEIEAKYLPKYAQYPNETTGILNNIAGKIKNGETPSKEMLDKIISEMSAQTGVNAKSLERDLDRCFSRNILGNDWQGVQKLLKTPKAKIIEDFGNGGPLSKKLENFKTKRNLQSDVNPNNNPELSTITSQGATVDTNKIQTILEQNGIKFDATKGKYNISPDARNSIQTLVTQKMGGDERIAQKFMENLPQTLSSADVSNIQKILNACGKNYSAKLLENPNELIAFYSNLKNSGFFKFGEISNAEWRAVLNLIQNPLSSNDMGAIMRYKGAGFAKVNEALTNAKKNGTPIPEYLQKEINALENCIESQKVSEPFTVHRTEGIDFLDNFKLNIDGQNISLLEAIKSCKTESDRLKLREHISNNSYNAVQERFTSTSMLKAVNPGTSDNSLIVWDLEVQPGSRGIYIEGANYTGKRCKEREFLLQKNSNIELTGIRYSDDGKWHLQGKISN